MNQQQFLGNVLMIVGAFMLALVALMLVTEAVDTPLMVLVGSVGVIFIIVGSFTSNQGGIL